jgi:dolichol-phosphate mannosyltransferase
MNLLYSFVVPIYNDGELAQDFCIEFEKVFQQYLQKTQIAMEVELIFVNDGSKNESIHYLKNMANQYSFVKVIDLSRNFGQHIALSAGYQYASGQFVGMLNVDMQEPPSQIPILLDYIKNNDYDIVFGLRQQRYSSIGDRLTSHLFNIILNRLTGNDTPINVSTLRIMNRRFVDSYNQLSEKNRYLPGLESWLGFKHGYKFIVHQERKKGKSSYNFKKRLLMALDAIISFSDIPLKIVSVFGIFMAFFGFFALFFVVISKLLFIDYQHGFASLISTFVFIGGLQILVVGLSGLYLGRILKEVQNRPLFVVRQFINFLDKQ